MRLLVGCELSGVVREAFRRRGHEAWSCDLEPAEDGSEFHIQGDLWEVLRDRARWDMLIAHPPCTHLCSAGNGWRASKDPAVVREALKFATDLITIRGIDRVCVENPVGIISRSCRPPDQVVQPWWFGDPVTKRTCLWLRGVGRLEKTRVVKPWDDSMWRRWGGKETARVRSRTFQGMADAMADQWG